MMNKSLVVVLVALVSISTANASEYHVTELASGNPELLATLNLAKKDGNARTLISRSDSLGLKSQIRSPRCGRTLLRRQSDGAWIVPARCTKVAWNVRVKVAIDGKVDVSTQATVKFHKPSWLLLSEPTSLLRLQGDNEPSTITIRGTSKRSSSVGATEISDNVWRVSSLNNAPEFFALGQIQSATRSIGRFAVRYVADNSARVSHLGLETMHERALEFLASVVPPPIDAPSVERSLLVIWVGIDETMGYSGGAAGSRSFVANYVFGKPDNESLNAARTLAVLAHEQFHQLADLARGQLPPLPTWLNESLAHYYGLKALQRASSSPDAQFVRARFINAARPVSVGLRELNRRHTANDQSVYPLFYEQGATFWSEIDSAISLATNGLGTLDDLVLDLLLSATTGGDPLPERFVSRLRERIGTKVDELLRKFVGD